MNCIVQKRMLTTVLDFRPHQTHHFDAPRQPTSNTFSQQAALFRSLMAVGCILSIPRNVPAIVFDPLRFSSL